MIVMLTHVSMLAYVMIMLMDTLATVLMDTLELTVKQVNILFCLLLENNP